MLPPDNYSKQIYFIEQGLARVFYTGKSKDVTLYFLPENHTGAPVDSIFFDLSCRFGIEALTKTTIASIRYDHWEALTKSDPALGVFAQKQMIGYIKKSTDRLYYLKFQSPLERLASSFARWIITQ